MRSTFGPGGRSWRTSFAGRQLEPSSTIANVLANEAFYRAGERGINSPAGLLSDHG
jgi:hypothetical protein